MLSYVSFNVFDSAIWIMGVVVVDEVRAELSSQEVKSRVCYVFNEIRA